MTHLCSSGVRRYVLILALATVLITESQGRDTFYTKRAASCSLIFASDFADKEPVLLTSSKTGYSLIEPRQDSVNLKADQDIVLACTGGKNTITSVGKSFTLASCVNGKDLDIDGDIYDLKNLGCTTSVTGEFEATTTKCGGRGVIKHIGYNVDGTFITLFDVCYDNNGGEALYADHVLYGSAIAYAKTNTGRPSFKSAGLGPGVTADSAYKQVTQMSTFGELLGDDEVEKYINKKSFLARGHLAPDGDFVFVTSQFSSYFYINTVPQWQVINNGNWKSLEFAVRKFASSWEENLRVITGSQGVLALEDADGYDTDIYLVTGEKLPVPKFVWKIVYSLTTKEAIAFVNLNNPFVTQITDDDYLCKDICKDYNWGAAAWTNTSKGLLYCCDVKELKTVVKTIPTLKISGILSGTGGFQDTKTEDYWQWM